MNKLKVVMLVTDGASSRVIYHELKTECEIIAVVVEEKVSHKVLLKNRLKKIGILKVFGQICFKIFNIFLNKLSQNRINEIIRLNNLNLSPIDSNIIVNVDSINDQQVEEILHKYNPDLIIVNGTRIIKGNILNCLDKPFINTHTGITPKYRGVHGGYWALANSDTINCGVTVHLVDEGIDTGTVLYQALIETSINDNFNTYPYLQTAKAIGLLKSVLSDVENHNLSPKKPLTKESALWSHPTLYEYIKNYIKLGAK